LYYVARDVSNLYDWRDPFCYVTLRSVLATSWKATGLVKPIWQRLPAAKDKRGELARLTGIPATNLSSLNTGSPMTMEMASRIVSAASPFIPGLSVLDLGAPEEAADEPGLLLLDRLRSLEDEAVRTPDLGPLLQVVGLLARGNRREALRVFEEAVER
jgi:hypothetical protein